MTQEKANDLLARMQDAALEDLQRMSDDDILKEAMTDGEDLKALATELRDRISARMALARRNRLVHARAQLNSLDQSRISSRARPPLHLLKQVVMEALRATPAAGVAFREGQRQTEADWESLYDDLVDIGTIKAHDDGR